MSLSPSTNSEMSPNDSLHYAIGLLAYCMASADGKVQPEERKILKEIVEKELSFKDEAFNVTEIIFHMMDKRQANRETTYNWALHQIKTYSHYLSPKVKQTFLSVLSKMAQAFPPITEEEKELCKRFNTEIEPLQGDPIYYKD